MCVTVAVYHLNISLLTLLCGLFGLGGSEESIRSLWLSCWLMSDCSGAVAVCCSTIVSVCACASDISSWIGVSAFKYLITDNLRLIELIVLTILPKFCQAIIYSQGVAWDRAAFPLRIRARIYSSNCL